MMNYVTMDYKFLNRVVDQLVRETRIDYDKERIYFLLLSFKFYLLFTTNTFILYQSSIFKTFFLHCRDVYGLNNEEIEYVWKEYRNIINEKI